MPQLWRPLLALSGLAAEVSVEAADQWILAYRTFTSCAIVNGCQLIHSHRKTYLAERSSVHPSLPAWNVSRAIAGWVHEVEAPLAKSEFRRTFGQTVGPLAEVCDAIVTLSIPCWFKERIRGS